MTHVVENLTQRELEVLRLLARGYDIKTAAVELSISPSAVSDRLRQARRKLGVSSSREAARILAAYESNGTFDVRRFSGVPRARNSPQSITWLLTKEGTTMTALIAAAAFVSMMAINHPTPESDNVHSQPMGCRVTSGSENSGTPGRSGNIHFDTRSKGKRTVYAITAGPKKVYAITAESKKAEFCITS